MQERPKRRTSRLVSQDPNFLRNEYIGGCAWDIPMIRKNEIIDPNIKLLSYASIRNGDTKNADKTIHFFIDDYKMKPLFKRNPRDYLPKLAQYANVLTPDFSLFTDLPLYSQLNNVAQSRYCGAVWQEYGLSVIPTVSWSDNRSYSFAFLGIEHGSTVAISTLGVRGSRQTRTHFLRGYEEMLKQINPSTIYCYGEPFNEMDGNVVFIDYNTIWREASGR